MKKIEIMGCGYIGLPTAITFTLAGYEVCGFDIQQTVVDTLNAGKIHIVEPGLQEAMTQAMATGRLRFTARAEPADVFIIAVQTPYRETPEGKRVSDMRYVESAARNVGGVIREGGLCVLESTSPPGSTRLVASLVAEASGLPEAAFMTAHCPERIIPGRMLRELRENDRIIGASRPEAAEYAKSIYEKVVTQGTIRLTDDLTAEMCKLTENTFRDINIAFANELSKVCDRLGIDVFQLISLANCHPRVNVHTPGVGVGGHCIAVDPWFIHEKFEDITPLIFEARTINDTKPQWVADRVERDAAPGARVAVLGMSFKADIDDTRESPSVAFAKILRDRGYEVIACEPYIQGPVAGFANHSLEEAMALCDYAVVTLGHKAFREHRDLIASKPYFDCVGLMRA
ncbi:MAG: nucleotide sugar dehydrogenase [Oscillospiraceae bacterium]|nr:nucleotide sugar dehydrogenase [Oscillospiraceae bacterium]